MNDKHPDVVVIGGPNGAGKSTVAPDLLRDSFELNEFVNADVIAQGLSGFDPRGSAVKAGRIMLARLRELADTRASFAFESTLSSRTFAPWISELTSHGYHFHLVFLWLPTADMAVARVQDRARLGGHDVPEETVRRRYARGMNNLIHLYMPLATTWRIYDNSGLERPKMIASGGRDREERVIDAAAWRKLQASVERAE
jgi:predicted ABC-type ATPase